MTKKTITIIVSVAAILLAVCAIAAAIAISGGEDNKEITTDNTPVITTEKDYAPVADAEELLSFADKSSSTGTVEAFNKVLDSTDAGVASYNGADDIIISREEHTDKIIKVKTLGKVELNSSAASLIITDAPDGLTVNAKVNNIIIDGDSVTADINCDTGSIYIKGKDVKLNIRDGKTANVVIGNSTAVIYNHTDEDVLVTLANGSTRIIEKRHTYQVKEDLISKGILD